MAPIRHQQKIDLPGHVPGPVEQLAIEAAAEELPGVPSFPHLPWHKAFLEDVAENGNITAAAQRQGIHPGTIGFLKSKDRQFREWLEVALTMYRDKVAQAVHEAAFGEGTWGELELRDRAKVLQGLHRELNLDQQRRDRAEERRQEREALRQQNQPANLRVIGVPRAKRLGQIIDVTPEEDE